MLKVPPDTRYWAGWQAVGYAVSHGLKKDTDIKEFTDRCGFVLSRSSVAVYKSQIKHGTVPKTEKPPKPNSEPTKQKRPLVKAFSKDHKEKNQPNNIKLILEINRLVKLHGINKVEEALKFFKS